MRQPVKKHIGTFLDEKDKLVIPKYQRGYDWKETQEVKDFFNDLTDCLKSENNELFLGSMILDVSREKQDIKEIIDGQQRMTTILLALLACRDYASGELRNEKIAVNIQNKISVTNSIGDVKDVKFVASKTIKDVFTFMVSGDWDGNFKDKIKVEGRMRGVVYQNRRVKPVYDYAYDWLIEYCERNNATKKQKLERFEKILDQLYIHSYVIAIEVEKKEDAFEIFERTNARGRNLEISDLLKNFLFSKEKDLTDSVQDSWGVLLENSEGSLPRMLKYFYVSRAGYTPNRDLYREIRLYAQENSMETFVSELKEFSYYFKAIRGKERHAFQDWLKKNDYSNNGMYLNELARSIGALNLFSITQSYPLIFSALNSFRVSKESNLKLLINMVRQIESYHYINNRIGTSIGNEVEMLYADYCEKFFNNKNFKVIYKEFEQDLNAKIDSEERFIAGIKTLLYEEKTPNINIYYAFDRLENFQMKDGQRLDLLDYHYKKEGVAGSYDIDHILSQDEAKKELDEEVYHALGNLMVIPKQINGTLGNVSFVEKIDIYKNPEKYNKKIVHIPLYMKKFATEHVKKEKWTKVEIEKRTKELAENLYKYLVNSYKY